MALKMEHSHPHEHPHSHEHCHALAEQGAEKTSILTIRSFSGLSGDMLVCGLSRLAELNDEQLNQLLNRIIPDLKDSVHIIPWEVNNLGGWHAKVDLPHQHEHRTFADIEKILEKNEQSQKGKELSLKTFRLLAEAEANVHGKTVEEVHFHEVGALDSILDICLSCELFALLNPSEFVVSPLPIGDGHIHCAHGVIPSPAPAVQRLLKGVAVRPLGAEGESVTPTAIALLKAFGAKFGEWPEMKIQNLCTVYGTKTFEGIPNGALFVYGSK